MTLSALSYLSIVTIGSSHVVTVVVECNCITNKMLVYVYVLCKLKVKCTLTHLNAKGTRHGAAVTCSTFQ